LDLDICRNNWSNDSNGISKSNILYNLLSILYISHRNNYILLKSWKNSDAIRTFKLVLTAVFSFYYQQISARSSFIGHVNATVEGLPTIRCVKVESILMDEFDSHQNLYTSTSYLYLSWLKAVNFIVHVYFIFFTYAIIIQFLIVEVGTKIFNLVRIM
jgi:hypothetical protein